MDIELLQNRDVITRSAEDTADIGYRLAHQLLQEKGSATDTKLPKIFCLHGDLGSGKTTFAQGFAKGLGIMTRLPSPTFIIVRRYDLPDNFLFYHIDLYRLHKTSEIADLGIKEIFSDAKSIVVVEWAERLGELLPASRLDISFEHISGENHKVHIALPET